MCNLLKNIFLVIIYKMTKSKGINKKHHVDNLDEVCKCIRVNDWDKRKIGSIKEKIKGYEDELSKGWVNKNGEEAIFPTNALHLMFNAARMLYKSVQQYIQENKELQEEIDIFKKITEPEYKEKIKQLEKRLEQYEPKQESKSPILSRDYNYD
jgi:hypothetical protein